jgi:hypothetical protein
MLPGDQFNEVLRSLEKIMGGSSFSVTADDGVLQVPCKNTPGLVLQLSEEYDDRLRYIASQCRSLWDEPAVLSDFVEVYKRPETLLDATRLLRMILQVSLFASDSR